MWNKIGQGAYVIISHYVSVQVQDYNSKELFN